MYLLLIMYYVVVKDQRREIPLSRLLKFSCQIAEGMGYLVCSRATVYMYMFCHLCYSVCACVFVSCVCMCLSVCACVFVSVCVCSVCGCLLCVCVLMYYNIHCRNQ